MQKLIIIRGHSGAGKTTFAQQKMAEFTQHYPNASLFHIENDHFLTKNGEYYWTPERFKLAKQQAEQAVQSAFSYAKQFPLHNLLIIISNVGINRQPIQYWISQADSLAMSVEIYRLQNFFHNQHNVSLNKALRMYIALQNAPLDREILVPPINPISTKIQQRLQQLKQET